MSEGASGAGIAPHVGMAIVFELLMLPIALLGSLVVLAVWSDPAVGSVLLGAAVFLFLFVLLVSLVRFASRLERESDDEQARLAAAEAAMEIAAETRTDSAAGAGFSDIVQECGEESFPASDPPAWNLGGSSAAAARNASQLHN